jgi:hypothetical protein
MKDLNNVSNAKFECLDDGDFVEIYQKAFSWTKSSFKNQYEKREERRQLQREY